MDDDNASLKGTSAMESNNIEVKEDYTDLPTAWYIPGIHSPDHETRLSEDVAGLIAKYRNLHGKAFLELLTSLGVEPHSEQATDETLPPSTTT